MKRPHDPKRQLVSIDVTSKNWRTSANIAKGSCAGSVPVVGCWWVVPVATGASVLMASMTGRLTLILRPRRGDFTTSR